MLQDELGITSDAFLSQLINSLPAIVQVLEVDELNRTLPVWASDNYERVTGCVINDRLKLGFSYPKDIYRGSDSEDVISATQKLLVNEGVELGLICGVSMYPLCKWMYIRLKRIYLLPNKRHVVCLAFSVDENFLLNDKKLEECISDIKRSQNKVDLSILTKTEKLVVKLLLQGLSTKDIAHALNRSFDTINNHNRNIFKKLKVHKMSELLMFAKEYGF